MKQEEQPYRISNGRVIPQHPRWGARVWYPMLTRLIVRLPIAGHTRMRMFVALRDFALPDAETHP